MRRGPVLIAGTSALYLIRADVMYFSTLGSEYCMDYFHEDRLSDGSVLSIDNLVLEFELRFRQEGYSDSFYKFLYRNLRLEPVYYINTRIAQFRYNFDFKCPSDKGFHVGMAFNKADGKPDEKVVRIDFNPNKLGEDSTLLRVLGCLRRLSKGPPKVIRFDLAADVPVERSSCTLKKDRRDKVVYIKSASNKTEYLGKREHHGYVKLYNKQIESKLPIPMTRLESTLKGTTTYPEYCKVAPVVWIIQDVQMMFDREKMTDTDRFVLTKLFDDPDAISMLGRKEKQKIGRILAEYVQHYGIEQKPYEHIVASIDYFVNGKYPDPVWNPVICDWSVVHEANEHGKNILERIGNM